MFIAIVEKSLRIFTLLFTLLSRYFILMTSMLFCIVPTGGVNATDQLGYSLELARWRMNVA